MISFRNKFWLFVSISITATTATLIFITWLVWSSLDPQQKLLLLEILDVNTNYLFIAAILTVSVFGFILDGIIQNYILPFKKIKDETRIILTANPAHRIEMDGPVDVLALVAAINEGAENFQKLKRKIDSRVREAIVDSENEKKILAAIISQLPHGIFICDTDGQIILFNRTARKYFSEGKGAGGKPGENGADGKYIGLGRYIFNIIDKPIVTHAMDEVVERMDAAKENPSTSFITSGRQGKMLRVEMVPILDQKEELTGFTLIATDISRRVEAENKINFLLRQLTTGARSSIAGIRAAVEAILEFENMEEQQKKKFLHIIHSETLSLSTVLDVTDREMPDRVRGKWSLLPIRMGDIINAVQTRAESALGIELLFDHKPEPKWFRGDSFPMIALILFILEQLKGITGCSRFEVKIGGAGQLVHLELCWTGKPLDREYIHQWRDEQISFGGESLPVKVGEVLKKHSAVIILSPVSKDSGEAQIRLVMPVIRPREALTDENIPILSEDRPEFYDFDLFDGIKKDRAAADRVLTDLKYTVFDTETTGLNPRGGDEIVSIGAVRIVNSRVMQEDQFDELVDPKRHVPWESVKIHGIQPEMLAGQPDINRVLPAFFQFSEDTVLVGHNVAFDMAMLEMKREQTGIKFENSVLDTMLLSDVIHPTRKNHSLEGIAERLGSEILGRHTALGDAMTTARLFLKMIPLLEKLGIRTLGEAVNASRKTYYARLKY